MADDPSAWQREILCHIEPDPAWDYARVVNLEQRLIKRAVLRLGWQGVWNKHYTLGGGAFFAGDVKRFGRGDKHTEEYKKERSVKYSGSGNPFYGKKHTAENNEKNKLAHLGKPLSDLHKQNIGRGSKKNWDENREYMISTRSRGIPRPKQSMAMMGANNPNYGPQPIIECPHCGKHGGSRIMKRWHFDNCKDKQ